MSCTPSFDVSMPDIVGDSSDYGSDFSSDEEVLLNELLAQVTTPPPALQNLPPALEDLQSLERGIALQDIEDYDGHTPRIPVLKILEREKPGSPWRKTTSVPPNASLCQVSRNTGAALVEHPSSLEGRDRERERDIKREQQWTQELQDTVDGLTTSRPADQNDWSPVERFRRPPNKAFSVSDLISPAWCELQYWYTLTKYGRKKRTTAMRQGSEIHKALEDEIYTTVPIEIITKEDAWALRIWNVIQGLRMLRQYGITREFEVWGLVDGELVIGVIDQLSYECPDSELEVMAADHYANAESARAALPEYQMSLTEFLLSPAQGGKLLSDLGVNDSATAVESNAVSKDLPPEVYDVKRIYMTDIKTKGKGSIPTVNSSYFRPTLHQLQLYYHMLNRLVTSDDVSIELLAARYGLDTERPFTDDFIMEVGGLNDRYSDVVSTQEYDPDYVQMPNDARNLRQSEVVSSALETASQDTNSMLVSYNTLSSLWKLMKDQLRKTFLLSSASSRLPSVSPSIPATSQPSMLESYPTTLSPLLTARFLSSTATTKVDTKVLGSRSFFFDPTLMRSYMSEQMEWWRGKRNPRGVEVYEAWKCRICDFRDECAWRSQREWTYANRRRERSIANSQPAE